MKNLDSRIINFFTAITWWTDVHWNITARWFAGVFLYLSYPILVFFWVLLYGDAQSWWTKVPCIVFAVITGLVGLGSMLTKVHMKLRDGFPNPHRVLRYKNRVTELIITTLWLLAFLSGVGMDFTALVATIGYLCSYLFEVFLACDKMPPGEKLRRQVKNELYSMTGSTT